MPLPALRILLPVTLLACPIAGTAVADTAITLAFDGTEYRFDPVMDGARTGFTRFASVDAVSIEGAQGPARLVLELALPPGAATGASVHDARLSFRPDGFHDYWVSPLNFPDGGVRIDHLDLSGPEPRVSGRFAVPLCFMASPLIAPDETRCLPAAGTFETALVRD